VVLATTDIDPVVLATTDIDPVVLATTDIDPVVLATTDIDPVVEVVGGEDPGQVVEKQMFLYHPFRLKRTPCSCGSWDSIFRRVFYHR